MKNIIRSIKNLTSTALLSVCIACGGAHHGSPSSVVPPTNPAPMTSSTALEAYLGTLASWQKPAAPSESETPVGPAYTDTAKDPVSNQDKSFRCTNYEHDVTKNYDQILWLAGAQTAVKPGMVIQGEAFKNGSLLPVPLRRSKTTVSIDLGVENPTRTVDQASTATLQGAIADLQREADTLADLPSTLTFNSEEVTSTQQIAFALGVHASYDGLIASGSFDSSFSHETGLTQHTVTAKLVQPMYTITFADDELPTPASFFAGDLTDDEWKTQAQLGTISSTNAPVFISSVTYGRMLLFTLASSQGESADQLSAAVRASASAFSGSATVDASQKQTLQTSTIDVLAIGGSSQAAAAALSSGDLSQFFAKISATDAVPISFVVKTVTGTREIALLGDVTKYQAAKCAPSTGGGWVPVTPAGKVFTSISGRSASDAYALSSDGVYHYDSSTQTFVQEIADSTIAQISEGIDGTLGLLHDDHSLVYRNPNTGAMEPQCAWAIEMKVYDHDHMAHAGGGNNIYVGNGNNNVCSWGDWGGWTEHVTMDGHGQVWHAGSQGGIFTGNASSGGWQLIADQNQVPGLVNYIAVGAPDDVYAVAGGFNYHYDATNKTFTKLSFQPAMTQLEVGYDGALWGIGPDGRVYRYDSTN
jgi:hypothetical protein